MITKFKQWLAKRKAANAAKKKLFIKNAESILEKSNLKSINLHFFLGEIIGFAQDPQYTIYHVRFNCTGEILLKMESSIQRHQIKLARLGNNSDSGSFSGNCEFFH